MYLNVSFVFRLGPLVLHRAVPVICWCHLATRKHRPPPRTAKIGNDNSFTPRTERGDRGRLEVEGNLNNFPEITNYSPASQGWIKCEDVVETLNVISRTSLSYPSKIWA